MDVQRVACPLRVFQRNVPEEVVPGDGPGGAGSWVQIGVQRTPPKKKIGASAPKGERKKEREEQRREEGRGGKEEQMGPAQAVTGRS